MVSGQWLVVSGQWSVVCDRCYPKSFRLWTAVAWDVFPKSKIWTRPQVDSGWRETADEILHCVQDDTNTLIRDQTLNGRQTVFRKTGNERTADSIQEDRKRTDGAVFF